MTSGTLRKERLNPEQLMPKQIEEPSSRKHGTEESLDGDQVSMPLKHYAGYVGSKDGPSQRLAVQLAKVVSMQLGGELAEAREETLILNPENFLVHYPHADTLYRMTRGLHKPELARSISESLLEDCPPWGSKSLVQ